MEDSKFAAIYHFGHSEFRRWLWSDLEMNAVAHRLCGFERFDTIKGNPMATDARILNVYQTGPLTVVGFGGQEVLDQVNIATCREEILQLVATHGTETLAFDLTGVKLIPSGLLGLLASLRNQKIKIQLYNPSADVQEVLEVTHLNKVLEVCQVDV